MFLNVKKEENLEGTKSDGVLGLGIKYDVPHMSLIESLYNQKQINNAAFSFYLLGINNISKIFIGDILKNEYIANLFKNKIQQCQVNQDSFNWECISNDGIIISNNNNKKEIFYSNYTFIFDSGTSFTIIPQNDFYHIYNFLKLDHNCMLNKNNELLCQCNSKNEFGKIEINFDKNNVFVLNLEKMIDNIAQNQCHFQIVSYDEIDFWILGDSALRGKIINFNLNERKISFVQNISGIIDENKIAKSKWIKNSTNLFFYLFIALIIFYAFVF